MGLSDAGDRMQGLDEATKYEQINTGTEANPVMVPGREIKTTAVERYADKEGEGVEGDLEEEQAVGAPRSLSETQQGSVQISRLQKGGKELGGSPSERESRGQQAKEPGSGSSRLPSTASQDREEVLSGDTSASQRKSQGAGVADPLLSRPRMDSGEHVSTSERNETMSGVQEGQGQSSKSTSVEKWADKAMYAAEPMPDLTPTVKLIWMTPDPLGAMAAMAGIYEGKVFRSLLEVSDDDRRKSWEAMQNTHLTAPLEFIKVHFLIENVDRAFTHQLVRQRTAVYGQESMRFAVKESLAAETPKPPSFSDTRISTSPSKRNDLDELWDNALAEIQRSYLGLIAAGVPAEDARGLLPTACLTRIHYCTDLRNLLEHAGNRLCTQAQFHWRSVFLQMKEQIRNYWRQMNEEDYARARLAPQDVLDRANVDVVSYTSEELAYFHYRGWQFELIADTSFKPQCYLQGKCTFKADFDRGCTIRERVDAFAANGVPSKSWGVDFYPQEGHQAAVPKIKEAEWLEDPQAAWVRQ